MKRIFVAALFSLVSFFFVSVIQAQVVSVPNKSEQHLAEKYPDAKSINWSNNVTNYNAKFNVGADSYKAIYHMDGTWDYTEKNSDIKKFPEAVQTSYKNSRIAKWKYQSAVVVENNKGEVLYRVEAKKNIEKIYVFFDEGGKEIKSASSL